MEPYFKSLPFDYTKDAGYPGYVKRIKKMMGPRVTFQYVYDAAVYDWKLKKRNIFVSLYIDSVARLAEICLNMSVVQYIEFLKYDEDEFMYSFLDVRDKKTYRHKVLCAGIVANKKLPDEYVRFFTEDEIYEALDLLTRVLLIQNNDVWKKIVAMCTLLGYLLP